MPDNSTRESNGHYTRGNPGGPGRPRSTVSRGAVALDEMGTEVGKKVFRMIVDKALAGDLKAAELLMSRVWPMRRGRPIEIDARRINAVADYVPAASDVASAVLGGEMTPDEGRAVSSLFQMQCTAIDAIDFERRLREVEEILERREKTKSTFPPRPVDTTAVFDGFSGRADDEKP